jgi:ribose/xylose/arabinose/galactoside ABC-type transport system permease subunit
MNKYNGDYITKNKEWHKVNKNHGKCFSNKKPNTLTMTKTQSYITKSFRRILTAIKGAIGARNFGLVLALGTMLIILSIYAPVYMSRSNFMVVGLQMTSIGIVSVGTAFLLISGNVDLSIGSLFGLVAVSSAMISKSLPVPLAIVLGITLGGIIGLGNGFLVRRIKVSPIIITLGSMVMLRGVALLITRGVNVQDVPKSFAWLGRVKVFGIPSAVIILAVIAIIAYVILSQTTIGRHLYAIGGNLMASEMAAVKVRKLTLGVFVFNGVLVGVAGVLSASRFGTATPLFGEGLELDVITAVILGGVAFSGGEGNLGGVMLAVVFLTVISSGLISLGANPFYTQIVKGGVLIAAVGIEQLSRERRDRYQRALAMKDRQ